MNKICLKLIYDPRTIGALSTNPRPTSDSIGNNETFCVAVVYNIAVTERPHAEPKGPAILTSSTDPHAAGLLNTAVADRPIIGHPPLHYPHIALRHDTGTK